MLKNVATSLLNNVIVAAIFELLLKHLGGAQDQVGRACAPVCPTLATPLLSDLVKNCWKEINALAVIPGNTLNVQTYK